MPDIGVPPTPVAVIPPHIMPRFSNAALEDALFHYTNASGLMGILSSGELWSTAYFCTNDESELVAGSGVLRQKLLDATSQLIETNDPVVATFNSRGVDVRDYARNFEELLTLPSWLCAYVTCFCKPSSQEDFLHGLLSQWRGYGADGGYALQFSRKKLLAEVENANRGADLSYNLQDVHYDPENVLKQEIFVAERAFLQAYKAFLDDLAKPIELTRTSRPNPGATLIGGPLESLWCYLIHTKSHHFCEERECRLSLIDAVPPDRRMLPTEYFNRGGLLVPYKRTPKDRFGVLKCLEWIVVGPSARLGARLRSVMHFVEQLGLDIKVRPSHIPFSRA